MRWMRASSVSRSCKARTARSRSCATSFRCSRSRSAAVVSGRVLEASGILMPALSHSRQQLCQRSFALWSSPTIVSFPEPGGLGVFLGTEPAIRFGQARITAARLQVIDADIAGDARAYRVLALDAAARRHVGIGGEHSFADL